MPPRAAWPGPEGSAAWGCPASRRQRRPFSARARGPQAARAGARSEREPRLGLLAAGEHRRHVLGPRRPVLVPVPGAAAEEPDVRVLRVAVEQELPVRGEAVVTGGRARDGRGGERGEA